MDFDTTILRHAATKKWFCAILQVEYRMLGIEHDGGADVLNLKCDERVPPIVEFEKA